jgi:uncharacterized circularly permuted ATP-grasp superfamily protein
MGSESADGRGFDEHRDPAGAFRPGYEQLFAALEGIDLAALSQEVTRHLAEEEVSFGGQPFVIDPVPRLITAAEWDELAAGLAQRARALNRFLFDAYGAQDVAQAGIATADALRAAEGFEPDLVGRLPPNGAPAGVIGFDVVRDPDGRFLVLEDNARTPSGFEYAIAARSALTRSLPPGWPVPRPIDPLTAELLAGVMRAAAPPGVGDPVMVVLTDGPANVAYSEHARAAARMSLPLVTLDQLVVRGDRLYLRSGDKPERRVDVVYRRSDEDRVRDEQGRMTEVAEALLPGWLSGNLGLVNAFGNGLADDKLIHSHVDDFIRFYLEQEPLVPSVPTYRFADAEDAQPSSARLREHVVKPRHGHGGTGVVVGPHAEPEALEQLASEIQRSPDQFISQPTVFLSRHPTVIGSELRLRHVDLRAFAFTAEEVTLMPGGLSRVALEEGKLVVNSSQNGGGKDTWVID